MSRSPSTELRLARQFIAACRRRKLPTENLTELLEAAIAQVRRFPEDERATAIDVLRWHLAQAIAELEDQEAKD